MPALVLALALAAAVAPAKEETTMQHARGTFDVVVMPVAPAPGASPDLPGRMTISKTFHGELTGSGAGEMLAVREGNSGAYVAMERVTGVLNGRRGAFAMVHRGVMGAGKQELLITVVPGSGTGELAGLTGVFHLKVEGGEHRYDLEYQLPADQP